MKTCLSILSAAALLRLAGGAPERAVGAQARAATIKVRFTNKTDLEVRFFLNGGRGLMTRLAPGASQAYNVVVDDGVQPIVGIYQTTGERLNFTLEDGGDYEFRIIDGKIRNAYAP
jgi:hypothetical protein